jgi:serine/threonine protein kinase
LDATAQLRGEPASGQLFADRYRLVERLGPARSASVWLGWDDLLGRPMAVKPVSTCSETPSARERALRAARLTGRLQHANVVAI